MDDYPELIRSFLGQVHVRNSALNPLLWLAGGGGLICFPAAYFMPNFGALLICVGVICVLSPIPAYIFFALKDPNRLQSEEYQLQQQHMQLRQGRENVEVLSVQEELISNPELVDSSDEGGF